MTTADLTGATGTPKHVWRLGANGTLEPTRAAADAALIAKFGGVVLRTSQEQGWGSVSARLGPFATACKNVGIELFQTCQPIGHVVPRTQAGLDAYGLLCAECTTVAHRTSTGNEVNGYGSKETPNPSGQADMLAAAIEAVAKYNPGGRLATPSLCPASGKLGASYVEPLLFFDTMIAAQPSVLDAPKIEVDWHGYGPFNMPATTQATWNTAWRTIALAGDLAKMGHPRMRVAWSEFGEPTGSTLGVTPVAQAAQFDSYLELLSSSAARGIHRGELIWYTVRDRTPTGADDWPAWCGLVDVHGNEKPIVAHFRAAATLEAA